jgi:hypothetical protein
MAYESDDYESDACEETGACETVSDEWPGLTAAIDAMTVEIATEDRVLERLERITRQMQTRGRARSKKQSKSLDERVKVLHEIAPDFTERQPLRAIAELFDCSQSAFDKGDYYENTLREKRLKVKERMRAAKRANYDEQNQAENRQAIRDNREHVESYEDVDDHIDATWDERQGGRFAN